MHIHMYMYLFGEDSHICLLGVCLLMTYVPFPPIKKII